MAMGQKENPNAEHKWLGLFFLLPIGFFRYPFLTRSHMVVGQNLRYVFCRDYHLFKRLLRVSGGTGF